MREIEFRFWNKEKKVMCYNNEDKSASYWDGVCCSNIALVNSILKNLDEYEVMQYTGLKDKNGTKIYEGDVLEFDFIGKQKAVVYFNDTYAMFGLKPLGNFVYATIDEGVVVGNKYDNPELLD